ncbi:MAG TPA: hypothetical protein DDY91_15230 [Planctomycetaceae bacterium]|nr:hypothetical protein [Planctomycetaceae bacterium]
MAEQARSKVCSNLSREISSLPECVMPSTLELGATGNFALSVVAEPFLRGYSAHEGSKPPEPSW